MPNNEEEIPLLQSRREFDSETITGQVAIGTNLRDHKFVDCVFERCALSSVKLDGAVMQCTFRDSKIEGINFFTIKRSILELNFERCLVRHSSFAELKLRGARFVDCTLENVDFADADLTEADFSGTSFSDCTFRSTTLTKADFRSASGYSIDPRLNKIAKARFRVPEVLGLLDSFDIRIE